MKKKFKTLNYTLIMILLMLSGFTISTFSQDSLGIVKDIVGNVYKTVKIGDQLWMKENLRTNKYNDGMEIPLISVKKEWKTLSTPAYCWYRNDEVSATSSMRGALYNWYTINTGKLCPTGWHVPSEHDWTILTDSLGGSNVAGAKLKQAGSDKWLFYQFWSAWQYPNNSSGFTAKAAGIRYAKGSFSDSYLTSACWWSSTETSHSKVWCRLMYYNKASFFLFENEKGSGLSVRCIKDK
jgi:uncharacterized protein (TIGR02145 family)